MQLISKDGLCAFAGVRACPKQSNTDERVYAQVWSVIDEELAPLGW